MINDADLAELVDKVRQMEKDIKRFLELNEEYKRLKEKAANEFGHGGGFSSRKGAKEMTAAELKNYILTGGA